MENILSYQFMTALPKIEPKPLTRERYIRSLVGSYCTMTTTPIVMREVAKALVKFGDTTIALAADTMAKNEEGHERLAQEDLAALGVDVTVQPVPDYASDLIELFTDLAMDLRPHGVFGYAYALEYPATFVTQAHIDEIQALVPAGVDITRARRLHSSLGEDRDHITWLVNLIKTFDQADLGRVLEAISMTVPVLARGAE